MFFDKFNSLCERRKVSPKKVAMDIGLSGATASKWKKTGATPHMNTLIKIADYFSVSVSDLLEETEKSPIVTDERLSERKMQLIDRIKNLSDSDLEKLERMIDLILQ